MRATLFTVSRTGPGQLSTMAKPRGGDWLDDEMTALADSGVTVVVDLLTPSESREVGLDRERRAATAAGLQYLTLPIRDRDVPVSGPFDQLVVDLAARIQRGEHVVAHCRYGIGRSSLIAAAVLVIEGIPAPMAWERIAAARGLSVPDTDEQRVFLETFAARHVDAPDP